MIRRLALACCFLMVSAPLVWAEGPVPKDEKKHTTLGKYVNAVGAYEMWKANPEKVKILDCRQQFPLSWSDGLILRPICSRGGSSRGRIPDSG